jgi:galactose mutarotase-like enzyme
LCNATAAQGYPGTLEVCVRYELLAHAAELRTTVTATTDKATPGACFALK